MICFLTIVKLLSSFAIWIQFQIVNNFSNTREFFSCVENGPIQLKDFNENPRDLDRFWLFPFEFDSWRPHLFLLIWTFGKVVTISALFVLLLGQDAMYRCPLLVKEVLKLNLRTSSEHGRRDINYLHSILNSFPRTSRLHLTVSQHSSIPTWMLLSAPRNITDYSITSPETNWSHIYWLDLIAQRYLTLCHQ